VTQNTNCSNKASPNFSSESGVTHTKTMTTVHINTCPQTAVEVQPPRSPDFNPLDFSLVGTLCIQRQLEIKRHFINAFFTPVNHTGTF